MAAQPTSRTQTERADQARARILEAAIEQFSENGLAGARTEQIAEAAGVNKALLYYYFKSKDELYLAALEWVAEGVGAANMAVLGGEGTAGERFLRSTLNHFDRIHSKPQFQSLMQQETIRMHRGEANVLSPIVEKVFRPVHLRTAQVIAEGIQSGELIDADPRQFSYAATGANIFYFLSAPMIRIIEGTDVLAAEELLHRRKASIEFLGMSIFRDREHGAQVAEQVLATTPVPSEGGYIPRYRNHLVPAKKTKRKQDK